MLSDELEKLFDRMERRRKLEKQFVDNRISEAIRIEVAQLEPKIASLKLCEDRP